MPRRKFATRVDNPCLISKESIQASRNGIVKQIKKEIFKQALSSDEKEKQRYRRRLHMMNIIKDELNDLIEKL